MENEQTFDLLYTQILQQGRGIEPLFHSLFSFMRRKTDFYKNSEQGYSYCEKAYKANKLKFEQDEEKEKQKKEKELKQKEKEKEKEKVKEVEKSSGIKEISKEEFERRKREEEAKNNPKPTTEETQVSTEVKKEDEKKEQEHEPESEEKKIRERLTKMDENLRADLLKKTAHLDDKNGGRSRNYTWVQNQVEQFEMFIPVDDEVKGNQIYLDYGSKHLKVVVKGETLVNGELNSPINADSFFWTLDEIKGKKVITITFEKLHRMNWWDHVIKGDDILSLQKVNPDPSKLSDLDDEMRPEVEKMMLENQAKMMGKPFHKDPKTNNMLQDFMKNHPEMDFSKTQFN